MFGYVVINKPELRFREYDVYRGMYCGLCSRLHQLYGRRGQIALNYDMNFLVLLLSALYEPESVCEQKRCILHPLHKQTKITNVFTEYGADMTILLTYFKCQDDWDDDQNLVKLTYRQLLKGHMQRIESRYPTTVKTVRECLEANAKSEQAQERNLDLAANHSGHMMAELFAYRHDEWEQTLRKLGFYLGKFIYLMDAYEDLEQDRQKGRYNVLIARYDQDPDHFADTMRIILEQMMVDCTDAFERLPILQHRDILRNILYSGVWTRFEWITDKRKEKTRT